MIGDNEDDDRSKGFMLNLGREAGIKDVTRPKEPKRDAIVFMFRVAVVGIMGLAWWNVADLLCTLLNERGKRDKGGVRGIPGFFGG